MHKTLHYTFLKNGGGVYVILIFNCYTVSSQSNDDCILEITDPNYFIVTNQQKANASNLLPVVFNMAFWQVNDANGFYPEPIDENDVLTVIAEMNMVYNEYGIFFKYKGLHELDSPTNVVYRQYINEDCETLPGPDPDGYMRLSRCQLSAFGTYVTNNGYAEPNSFNVYIPYNTVDYGGSSFGSRLTFNKNGVSGAGMVHEIGHTFGLHHTHGKNNDNINWRHPTDSTRCEHVTRDENITPSVDPINYFNAFDKGDDIKDTAAVPNFDVEYCHFNGLPDGDCYGAGSFNDFYINSNDPNNCTYTGTQNTDCTGVFYEIFDADVQNYMSYTKNICRNSFTPDQVATMQGKVTSSQYLINLQTNVEALYEPYKGEYYLAGPLLDDVDYRPLFQPGFDYYFIECDGTYPQPAPYNDNFYFNPTNVVASYSKDEQIYASITHPNHTAIRIHQMEVALGHTNVKKCYNNFNRAARGGRTMRFNDGYFNTNITMQELDSLQINSPQFINNLNAGLYKIEKDYNGDAKQETVILK